jgi:Ca2+/Na+ antiporter
MSSAAPTQLPSDAKATLSEFIDNNYKLVTSLAAFIAVTAFSSQLPANDIKLDMAGFAFLGAFLLAFELLRKLPASPRQWRLDAFAYVLVILLFTMGQYWVTQFQTIWAPLLSVTVVLVLFLVLTALPAHLLTKPTKFIAKRFFHRDVPTNVENRLSQYGFFFFVGMLFVAWLLIEWKFAGRQLSIHFPDFKVSVTK